MVLILIGILSACILLVENMVLQQPAYVYIYSLRTWHLVLASIATGTMLGWGLKGKFSEKQEAEDDSYNF